MNTLELLGQLDFQAENVMGMGFYHYNPTEFTLNVHKESGAERYHLYGDKDNFVISLGPSRRGEYTFLSACPTSEALPYLISLLSKADGFSREKGALEEFKSNLESGKLSSLGEPEENYSRETRAFLDGAKTRTLDDEEIKNSINEFRAESGYDKSFDFNKEAIMGKIGEMRSAAFATHDNNVGLSFSKR